MSTPRYLSIKDSSSSKEKENIIETSYDDVSYSSVPFIAYVDFVDETGTLTINFGIKGKKIEVLETDALALITIIDGKLADIELLLSNKEAIKKLSNTLKPYRNR